MRRIVQMRKAFDVMRGLMQEPHDKIARVASTSDLNVGFTSDAIFIESTEEINATITPSSISTTSPDATGSTAQATISGTYDGSSGTGPLTFEATLGGTHGVDDLQYTVYDSSQNQIGVIDISSADPSSQQYTLDNGMVLELGEGSVLQGDSFSVDVTAPELIPITTFDAEFSQSTAAVSIGGTYDGSDGTGPLTFEVDRGGTHGKANLAIDVYDSNNNLVDTVRVLKKDSIDKEYSLSNGLTLTLGAGDLVAGDQFSLDLYTSEPVAVAETQSDYAGSSAAITLGGTYDGSSGDDSLTFQVTQGGTQGVDNLQVSVYDSSSNLIDQVNIASTDPANQTYAISNGMTLSVGEGTLLAGDVFNSDVLAASPEAVNPDNPFNGTGAADPNLDPDQSVSAGSFEINGVSIAVAADDSINTVLDKINQSEAGVAAVFDASNEKIVLTENGTGETPGVQIGNDTSGFVAAMKLDNATPVSGGVISNANKLLSEVESFSAVQSGTISVNDVAIEIDVSSDSLNDVLARISNTVAGVTASFDDSTQRVTMESEAFNMALTVDSGETNFFAAAGIEDGEHAPDVEQAGSIDSNLLQQAENLLSFASSFTVNSAESAFSGGGGSSATAKILSNLINFTADTMTSMLGDSELMNSNTALTMGLRNNVSSATASAEDSMESQSGSALNTYFDFMETVDGISNASKEGGQTLESVLNTKEGRGVVREIFFGNESGGGGIVDQMDDMFAASESKLEGSVGSSGVFVDEYA